MIGGGKVWRKKKGATKEESLNSLRDQCCSLARVLP